MNFFNKAFSAETADQIKTCLQKMESLDGPLFMEIKCNSGHRKNLGRPTRKPIENKSDFMHFLAIN